MSTADWSTTTQIWLRNTFCIAHQWTNQLWTYYIVEGKCILFSPFLRKYFMYEANTKKNPPYTLKYFMVLFLKES